MRSQPVEPCCPVNFFGRGVNYQMPVDEKAALWFDEQWEKWEAAHPDDATGEIAYAEFLEEKRLWEQQIKGVGAFKDQMEVEAVYPPMVVEEPTPVVELPPLPVPVGLRTWKEPKDADAGENTWHPYASEKEWYDAQKKKIEEMPDFSEPEPLPQRFVAQQNPISAKPVLATPSSHVVPMEVWKWMGECAEEERQVRQRSVQGIRSNFDVKHVRLTVDGKTYADFYKLCKRNSVPMSSLVERFMQYATQLSQ